MRKNWMVRGLLIGGLLIAPSSLIVSCGQPQNKQCQLHSKAEYYLNYKRAMEAFDRGEYGVANHKIEVIIQCDKKFAPAHAVAALLYAHDYNIQIDPKVKKQYWERAQELIKKSIKFAKGDKNEKDSQKFIGHVTAIRVYTMTQAEKDWLDEAEDHFEDALDLKHIDKRYLPYYKGKESAYYFMGVAYYTAGKYDKAKEMLKAALNIGGSNEWIDKANRLLTKIQKIERVMARYSLGDIGKVLAKKDKITRAELAALLVDEIDLPKLFLNSLGSKVNLNKTIFEPLDIKNNPYKEEILTVMKLGLMKPVYDPKSKAFVFEPNKPVTRCELAMILQDIYAKLTNNPQIKFKYATLKPSENPFKDLDVTNPCFNAMMLAVNMNWLNTDQGYVHPNQPVNGADALEALYELKNTIMNRF